MDYKRLSELIRRFVNIELLAQEIESLEDMPEIETIDDLSGFLEEELDYAEQ